MPKQPRTFKLPPRGERPMKGTDIKEWQKDVRKLFRDMKIYCPIKVDGIYDQADRAFTAALCEAMGLISKTAMKDGVTPELRVKLRNKQLTKQEELRKDSKKRKEYREKLRWRWLDRKVHSPVSRIITDDWGYHPGVHDGIDVQSIRGAAVFAMVKGRVIDVRMGDWWGSNPSGNVALGDGIVQIEVLESIGPFKKGQHIGYGHTEQPNNKPIVKRGQIVEAGEVIGMVGVAVTPHVHLMLNDGSTNQGRGTMNPRRHLDYSLKHG